MSVDNKKLAEVLRTVCDGKPKKVGKVNIMRSNERVDSSGTGRSKGFGFAEFSTHEDALEVLRAMNNNPEVFGPERRPIVEFAIENSLILKHQEQRKVKSQQKREGLKGQQDSVPNKQELGNQKGEKRKRDQRDRRGHADGPGKIKEPQESQGHTDGFGKKIKHPRKRQETGKTVDANASQELNHKSKNRIKTFDSKIKDKAQKVHSLNSSSAQSPHNKDMSSSRSKHKQREKANKEEDDFNKIVQKYKSKLFGDNIKQLQASRWFQ